MFDKSTTSKIVNKLYIRYSLIKFNSNGEKLTNIPMKQKIGVIFPISETSLTPNATANVIQLKHNPNAEACKFDFNNLCYI